MYIKIDRDSRTPAYLQIYSAIRSMILSGVLSCGSRLPSRRELARDCDVSVITAEHACQLLSDEGLCEMRSRSGCYVRYDPAYSFPLSDLPDNSDTEYTSDDFQSDGIPFSAVSGYLRRVTLDYGERILMKSPNNGCPELRDAISKYLARSRSIQVDPSQIVIGSGAEYLYGIVIQMLGRDKTVALEDPSYEKIRQVYAANGAEYELLAMYGEGIRTDELARSKAQILHVTPFNSYPSHITASEQCRKEYLRWAKERGAIIVEDDYDSEYVLTGSAPETLFSQTEDDNVIYINTFSKTIAPSIRAGYMILPKPMLMLYNETVGFYSCTVPMLEQFFLTEWLSSGEFERNIARMRTRISDNNTPVK